MEDSESAEKQENTGIGPASTCRVMRGQKRVEDARERAYDPRIHLLREKFLRRWMDCRVKPGNDSEGVVPAKAGTHSHRRWLWVPALAALGRDDESLEQSTNLRLYRSAARAISLFRDCYLQWLAQLQRVGPVRAHMSPPMCHHP
jgi:hypothetical protein